MRHARTWICLVSLGLAVIQRPSLTLAQGGGAPGGWVTPDYTEPQVPVARRSPAPRRSIAGTWIPIGRFGTGTQAGGVHLKPNDGRPENQLPYTPFGLKLYQAHKALEGVDAVPPALGNDPRNLCEPLGMPRVNHYNLNLVQIMQDDYKVAVLYQFDNRWRVIWTDGRQLPKVVEGGAVNLGGEIREQRFLGYSVGRWSDDTTLEAVTVGTMPEDRVWLDSTGRPISDQVRVTERIRRLDSHTIEWSETIDDPKVYSKPWETMRLPMRIADPRTDVMEYYCSPVEQQNYNRRFGNSASGGAVGK
jgi:hypothetical protein